MINFDDNNEDILKDLIKKTDLEHPPKDFTQNVMSEIKSFSTSPSQSNSFAGSRNLWILVSVLSLASLVYLVYYFLGIGQTLSGDELNPLILPVIERIFGSLQSVFQSIQISSFTWVIIGAVVILFLADGVLRKLQIRKNIYFSF